MESLRILDFADDRGLLAGRLLADMGADVVRIDCKESQADRSAPPLLGETSLYWEVFGANRSCVSVDSYADPSVNHLLDLADALILTGSPQELIDLGLQPEVLLKRHPRLVIAVISPFGLKGQASNQVATDLTIWAAGGGLEPHRSQLGIPLRPSAPQSFLHAGADAAIGVLLALIARAETGQGQIVDVSAQASLSTTTLGRIVAHAISDPSVLRPRATLSVLDRSGSGAATSGDFKKWHARDGLIEFHLAMGPASGRFTNSFMKWMIDENQYPTDLPRWDWVQVPELIESGEFTEEDLHAVRAATREFFASKTRSEVRESALERKLLCVGISQIDDVARDQHFIEREIFHVTGETGNAPLTILDKWVHVSGGREPSIRQLAPPSGDTPDPVITRWEVIRAQQASHGP